MPRLASRSLLTGLTVSRWVVFPWFGPADFHRWATGDEFRVVRGQIDKGGAPYILHPLRVMAGVEGTEARIVAVFQDVIEDTPDTADYLRQITEAQYRAAMEGDR